MVLTIVLYTCVLALVDLQAPGFFTGVFTCLSGCRASVVDGEQDFLSHTVLCSWNCSPAQDSIVVCSFPLRTKDFHLSSKGRPAYA
jgi:hypothetical protein